MSHFEVYLDASDESWRWTLKATNGETVASGEGYTRKEDAERGTKDVTQAVLGAVVSVEPEVRDGEAAT